MPALLTRMSIGPPSSTAATPAAAASGSVTSKRAALPARWPSADEPIGGGGELRLVAAVEHDLGAVRGEALGQREADALAGAGDESAAAGEIEERESHGYAFS